jgi:hypothetical protein
MAACSSTLMSTPTPTLSSIAVTPVSPGNLTVGSTQLFTAAGTYSDGSTADISSQVTWTSSDTTVATIDSNGLATGVAAGTANVTATLSGITCSAEVTSTYAGINPVTGTYKNYYLGLVNTPEGDVGGDGCYDDTGGFIVLINNKDATNPTYNQLVTFLQNDKTDEHSYISTLNTNKSYFGTAESHVDLKNIQNIIDGTAQPTNPDVCADFAERLHNDAELSGIKCGYVTIDLSVPGGHACDAFQITDESLIYIDFTGENSADDMYATSSLETTFGKVSNYKKIAYIQVGEPYGLISLDAASNYGFQYSGYSQWEKDKQTFDSDLSIYNNQVDAYNSLVESYNAKGGVLINSPEDIQLKSMKSSQDQLNQQILNFSARLGGFWDQPGIVTGYKIIWDGSWSGSSSYVQPTTTLPSPTPTITATIAPLPPFTLTIAVTPASPANLAVGSTQQFTAVGNYSDGSQKNFNSQVTWSSSNPGVATISPSGLATGVAAGSTSITASMSRTWTLNPVNLTVVSP